MRARKSGQIWVVVIVVTLAIFAAGAGVAQLRYVQGARQLQSLKAYRDNLSLQVDDLAAELDFARTDDYVVRVARDELGMIMPGEVRYVNGAR